MEECRRATQSTVNPGLRCGGRLVDRPDRQNYRTKEYRQSADQPKDASRGQQVQISVMCLIDDGIHAKPLVRLQARLHSRIDTPKRAETGTKKRTLFDLVDDK